MTRTLLRKELRQHAGVFIVLGALTGIAMIVLLVKLVLLNQAGSKFEALRGFAMVTAFSAAILGSCLVTGEYKARTQLFLEALPLPRIRVVLVKYFLGLAILAVIVLAGFLLTLLLSYRTEVITRAFLGILLARFGASALCLYSFFFMAGFLGRYRLGFYATVIFGVIFLTTMRDFEFDHFGPFRLMDNTFAYERETIPREAFFVTLGISGFAFLVAVLLATIREGSVASMMGERMSHREKVAVTVFILALFFSSIFLEEKKTKRPYDLHEAAERAGLGLSVKVSPDSTPAEALAQALSIELAELRDYLAIDEFTPLFIILRTDLDPDLHEKGKLENAEGLVVRTNFTHPEWDRTQFTGFIVEHLLHAHSEGRTEKEDRAWIVDGFKLFWTHRAKAGGALDASPNLLLRALYGTEGRAPINREDTQYWFRLRDRYGRGIAEGIAWSGLRAIEAKAGPEKCRAFLRSVLGSRTPRDLRTTIADFTNPLQKRLEVHTGILGNDCFVLWNRELDHWRLQYAANLAALPRLQGDLSFEALSSDSFLAHYRLEGGPGTASLRKAHLLYAVLEPFQSNAPDELQRRVRIDLAKPETLRGTLPEDYPRGTRLYYTFAAHDERLGCRLISAWQRKEVR